MPLLDPKFSTRRRLKFALTVAGFAAGAIFGIVLTRVGKVVADAPPATLANYAWNAMVFGIISAVVSPVVTWSTLRRVPLWRTVLEPLALAVVGGAMGVVIGFEPLFLVLPPIGLVAGFVHLQRRYPGSSEDVTLLASDPDPTPHAKQLE